ncbi:hypothetical protein B0T26DRAFT_600655, partial [Lasiosphaeria miniovina]
HAGVIEPDYGCDTWADYDENCYGPVDTGEIQESYPEGLIWTCCEKRGHEDGCKLGRHESDPAKNKQ